MIALYDHNEEGYQNLEELLKDERFAAINHATGTGKSFIALKYLSEHKNRRFLYIAPTYEIINQFMLRDMKDAGIKASDLSVDTMIYRGLLNMDVQELYDRYDGFILDEYHRTGAAKTYEKILELKHLIENGKKDKKIIGLTATPIRYLDSERNMADEVFNGNVASNISLAEAIVEGILPVPNYFIINGFLEDEYDKTRKKIKKLYPSLLKDNLLKEVDEIEKVSVVDNDLRALFSENIKENGKYIFFSSSVAKLKKAMRDSVFLFGDFKDVRLYEVHSYMTKDRVKAQIAGFDDAEAGLNIMFAVDLFSEGVHPKKVDGVILNRNTSSPIIYFQQLGRALTSSNMNNTVQIFDLKSNYFSHEAIIDLYNDIMDLTSKKMEENPEGRERYEFIRDSFTIIDKSNKYLSKLKVLRKLITYEVIISTKIEYIIDTLELYIKENNIGEKELSGISIDDINIRELYFQLYEYREFISDDDRERLNKLNIVLPSASHITKDEKIVAKIDYFIDSLEVYIEENDLSGEVITDFNISDMVLKKLYFDVLKYSSYITDRQLKKLQELNVLLTPEIMKDLLDSQDNLKEDNHEGKVVYEILEYIDSFNYEADVMKDKKFKRMFVDLSDEYKEKVKSHIKIMFKKRNSDLIKSFNPYQKMITFAQTLRACDLDSLNALIVRVEFYKEKISYLNETVDNQIKNQTLDADNLINDFNDVLTDKEIELLLTGDVRNFKISLLKDLKDIEMKYCLCEYVVFCLKNKRRPVSKMDQDEISLSERYAEVRGTIPRGSFDLINNYLNSEEIRKGTTEQIVLNAKANDTYVRGKMKK